MRLAGEATGEQVHSSAASRSSTWCFPFAVCPVGLIDPAFRRRPPLGTDGVGSSRAAASRFGPRPSVGGVHAPPLLVDGVGSSLATPASNNSPLRAPLRLVCPPVAQATEGVGTKRRHLVEDGDAGPVAAEDSLAVTVSLHKGNCPESGPLGCKVKPSYP